MYSLACAELRLGHPDQAAAALQAAFEKGMPVKDLQSSDLCLQDMLSEPRLRDMILQYRGK
jgi:hypothetical protein